MWGCSKGKGTQREGEEQPMGDRALPSQPPPIPCLPVNTCSFVIHILKFNNSDLYLKIKQVVIKRARKQLNTNYPPSRRELHPQFDSFGDRLALRPHGPRQSCLPLPPSSKPPKISRACFSLCCREGRDYPAPHPSHSSRSNLPALSSNPC